MPGFASGTKGFGQSCDIALTVGDDRQLAQEGNGVFLAE